MSSKVSFFVVLFVYSLVCRLLPYALYHFGVSIDPDTTWYPWNFSPLMAVSLFGGACATDRRWSFALPLSILVLSDFGIWAITGNYDWAFPRSQPVIYGCFAAAAGMGLFLRQKPGIANSIPMAIAAETVFFLVTNFATWYAGEGNVYPMTIAGLGTCYVAGLPFFGRSLISTSLYTVALFSPVGLTLAGHSSAITINTREAQA